LLKLFLSCLALNFLFPFGLLDKITLPYSLLFDKSRFFSYYKRVDFRPMKQKILKNTNGLSFGFTLIEILLVIALIAILAGIVIFAINVPRQLGAARNSQRRSDVNNSINALHQYALDSAGVF